MVPPFSILDAHLFCPPSFSTAHPILFHHLSSYVRGSRFKPFVPSPPLPGVPASISRRGFLSSTSPFLCALSSLPFHRDRPDLVSVSKGTRFPFRTRFSFPTVSFSSSDNEGVRMATPIARGHFDVQAHVARCLRTFRRDKEEDGGWMGTSTHHEPMQRPGNQERWTWKRPRRTVGDDTTMKRRNTSSKTCNDGCNGNERHLACWNVQVEC